MGWLTLHRSTSCPLKVAQSLLCRSRTRYQLIDFGLSWLLHDRKMANYGTITSECGFIFSIFFFLPLFWLAIWHGAGFFTSFSIPRPQQFGSDLISSTPPEMEIKKESLQGKLNALIAAFANTVRLSGFFFRFSSASPFVLILYRQWVYC